MVECVGALYRKTDLEGVRFECFSHDAYNLMLFKWIVLLCNFARSKEMNFAKAVTQLMRRLGFEFSEWVRRKSCEWNTPRTVYRQFAVIFFPEPRCYYAVVQEPEKHLVFSGCHLAEYCVLSV